MKEVESLIYQYCDGTISTEDFQKLEALLRESEESQKLYASILANESALIELIEEEQFSALEFSTLEHFRETDNESSNKFHFARKFFLYAGSIAALLLLSLVFWTWNFNSHPISNKNYSQEISQTEKEPELHYPDHIVAVVAKTFGDHTLQQRLSKGDFITKGSLELNQGTIQLEFTSGVIMIVEGPARLMVNSDMHVICESGKLTVEVPDIAHGFTVHSKELEVRDLGTSFSMVCTSENSSVIVNDGSVELITQGSIIETLQEGQARAWNPVGTITPYHSEENFIDHRTIEQHIQYSDEQSYSQWKAHANKVQQREDLVLFYDFEHKDHWSRQLTNRGHSASHGAIIGAEWVEGRWPQKKALRFRGVNDRVRLKVPGEYQQISMTAWIRVESFDQWLSSLLLSDDFKEGALHWQVSNQGELIAGINTGTVNNIFSKPVLGLQTLGQWAHVAVTYDAESREVIHYLNGQEVTRGNITDSRAIELGICEIGNWRNVTKQYQTVRGFNGVIDEFMIFSSTLSPSEIKEFYYQGRP